MRSEPVGLRFSVDRVFPGLPHRIRGRDLIISRANEVLRSPDLGQTWSTLGHVHGGLLDVHLQSRAAERLLRRAVSNVVVTGEGTLIAVANRRIYRRPSSHSAFSPVFRFEHGSRPMHRGLCAASDGSLYVGEYHANPRRKSIRLYQSLDDGQTWALCYAFPEETVRHIHAVQEDPFRPGDIWLLCGDVGDEPRIVVTRDAFRSVQVFGGGDQTFRATALVFTDSVIYYGMDSPTEQSWVFRVDRATQRRHQLVAVGGPIYYGYTNANGTIVFGTTVEPGVARPQAELWASNAGLDWERIALLRKDCWPQPWFQHGCYYFPEGVGADDVIVFGAVGLKPWDGMTVVGRALPVTSGVG